MMNTIILEPSEESAVEHHFSPGVEHGVFR